MPVDTASSASSTRSRGGAHGVLITPPLFAMAFGLAGMAGTWRISGQHWAIITSDVTAAMSAVLLVALVIPWASQLIRRDSRLGAELCDPVLGPSVPVPAITAMLLSASLPANANPVGRTLAGLFAALTLLAGLAVVSAWVLCRLPLRSYHPGFYLPTAGGSLLAAQCVFGLGWTGLARVLFFIGLTAWLVLGTATSLRLRRAPLAPALRPMLAMEIAAPALTGNAYLVVFHHFDGYAIALASVTFVMGLVQVALIPYFRRASFGAAFWVSSFSYATAGTLGLRWINHERLPGADGLRVVALGVPTAVVLLLVFATVRAIAGGRFLPRRGR